MKMKIRTTKDLLYFCHTDNPSDRATITIPKGTILDAAERTSLTEKQFADLVRMERIEGRKQGRIARLVPFFYSKRPDIITFRTAIYGKEVIFHLRN